MENISKSKEKGKHKSVEKQNKKMAFLKIIKSPFDKAPNFNTNSSLTYEMARLAVN